MFKCLDVHDRTCRASQEPLWLLEAPFDMRAPCRGTRWRSRPTSLHGKPWVSLPYRVTWTSLPSNNWCVYPCLSVCLSVRLSESDLWHLLSVFTGIFLWVGVSGELFRQWCDVSVLPATGHPQQYGTEPGGDVKRGFKSHLPILQGQLQHDLWSPCMWPAHHFIWTREKKIISFLPNTSGDGKKTSSEPDLVLYVAFWLTQTEKRVVAWLIRTFVQKPPHGSTRTKLSCNTREEDISILLWAYCVLFLQIFF